MKQFLKYNYNLKNPTIYKVKNNIKVKDGNNRYLLCNVTKPGELEEIYQLLIYENISNLFFKINKNIDAKTFCNFKGTNYVLLTCDSEDFSTRKILKLSKKITGQLVKTNWKELWIEKKEYYEKIIKSRPQNEYNQILFDYYSSMAETAILYLNNKEVKNKNQIITFRVFEKSEQKNPLNLIVDIEEREVSEKIRKKILNEELNLDDIKVILSHYSEQIDLELVYARLLFPNYYYDGLLKSVINKTDFNILVSEINTYEQNLRLLYREFNNLQNIKKVDWL